jgi:hypothetical protein
VDARLTLVLSTLMLILSPLMQMHRHGHHRRRHRRKRHPLRAVTTPTVLALMQAKHEAPVSDQSTHVVPWSA